jgi:sporulation protein YlmC with PRC-barrel domain
MVFIGEIEGNALMGADGVPIGTVTNVLFHPSEPRVIGVAVRPPAMAVVVSRKGTYLPLSALSFGPEGASCEAAKLPTGRKAAEGLGFDPDRTVIWSGMPVADPHGREIGVVRGVSFDGASGIVDRIDVGSGTVADVAHGRYLVPGDAVTGFEQGAIRITAEVGDLQGSGGLAVAAARGAVAAKVAARAAGSAVVGASGATGKAIRAVAQADLAKRATSKARNTWRDSVRAFRDGMKDDE